MGSPTDARKQWREQQRAQRLDDAETQRAALEAQADAARAWTDHARRAPTVARVSWAGVEFEVLNLEQARRLLARIRDTDNAAAYALMDEAAQARFPLDDTRQWVFLAANGPVRAATLDLPDSLPDHPRLRVAGWIFRAGLQARRVSVGDAAQLHDEASHDEAGGPWLIVDGPCDLALLMLPAGEHAFTSGLAVHTLLARDYRCRILVRGRLDAACLIAAGGDVCLTEAPRIDLLATDDANPDRARIMSRHGRSYRFHPPTHLLDELVTPARLRRDARGHARLALDLTGLEDAQGLLRPRAEIDAVYAGFADELAQALEDLAARLRGAGPARLSARFGGGPADEASYEERAGAARELVRQIAHSVDVRVSATQPAPGAPVSLRLEALTAPVRERHVREATPADDDAEALAIKRALRAAIERLRRQYPSA